MTSDEECELKAEINRLRSMCQYQAAELARQPPAATPDASEREHADRAVCALGFAPFDDKRHWRTVDMLMCERAAAFESGKGWSRNFWRDLCDREIASDREKQDEEIDAAYKAGFERGRAESESDLVILRDHVRQWVEARNALQAQLTATQGMLKDERERFKELVDRMRANVKEWRIYMEDAHQIGAVAYTVCCTDVEADLSAIAADKDGGGE